MDRHHGSRAESASAGRLERLAAGLDRPAEVDPGLAQLVDLHFFCGFSFVELAELRGVSGRTITRDWRKTRLPQQTVLKE